MTVGPDSERLADARRRAAFAAEQTPARSIHDASRILALDVLLEFVEGVYNGELGQIAWALQWTESATDLEPHEATLRESAWQKIHDNAAMKRLYGGNAMFSIDSRELLEQNAGPEGRHLADALAEKVTGALGGFPASTAVQRAAIAGLVARALAEWGEREAKS